MVVLDRVEYIASIFTVARASPASTSPRVVSGSPAGPAFLGVYALGSAVSTETIGVP